MHSCFESISCLIRCHTVRRALERRVHLKVKIRHWHAERQNKKCSLYLRINFGWGERRGGLLNFLSTLFQVVFFISLLIHLYQLLKKGVFTQKVTRGDMFFFPFSFFGVDEGMRFWKWILITTVKVFAYSANIGWRSLRCVCGPRWRIILGSQRAQDSLCGVAQVCTQTHIYKWLLSPWLLSSWPRKAVYSRGQCPVSHARRGMDINAAFSLTEEEKWQSFHPQYSDPKNVWMSLH